jgi:hypothetical protein
MTKTHRAASIINQTDEYKLLIRRLSINLHLRPHFTWLKCSPLYTTLLTRVEIERADLPKHLRTAEEDHGNAKDIAAYRVFFFGISAAK